MSFYYTFAAVCGSCIGVCAIACLVLEGIRLHRTQVNKDIVEQNRNLRTEIALVRSQHANAIYETTVHAATIKNLVEQNDALTKENEELKAGTPVCTGYRFVK